MKTRFIPGLVLGLAACGGAGDNTIVTAPAPVTGIELLRTEAGQLDAAIANAEVSSRDNVPTSGSAQYDGVALLTFLPDSPLGSVVGGDMTVDIGFANQGVTGTIDNFYSRDGDAREGELTLSNGVFFVQPNVVVVAADIDGEVDLIGGLRDVEGGMAGSFRGETAGFINGAINLTSTLTLPNSDETTPLSIEGSFSVQRQSDF